MTNILTEEEQRRKYRSLKDGEILRDGERVSTSMMLMDSLKPGGVIVADDDRQRRAALQRDADAKLSSRWKNPSPLADTAKPARSGNRRHRQSRTATSCR